MNMFEIQQFFISTSWLLSTVHLDFLTGKTRRWAVQGGTELTLCFRFVFALVASVPFYGSAARLCGVLSLADLHPAFSMVPTVWIPSKRSQPENTWPVLTFSCWLWRACEPRQGWVRGLILWALALCFVSSGWEDKDRSLAPTRWFSKFRVK